MKELMKIVKMPPAAPAYVTTVTVLKGPSGRVSLWMQFRANRLRFRRMCAVEGVLRMRLVKDCGQSLRVVAIRVPLPLVECVGMAFFGTVSVASPRTCLE